MRLWKFRCAPDAAIDGIDRLHHAGSEVGERGVRGGRGSAARHLRLQPCPQYISVLADFARLRVIEVRHLLQDLYEGRAPEPRVLREIGTAPEGLGACREEHCERPAALLAERMQRAHIDRVHVGALLAIHLDVDEEVVHHRGGGVVLEALMRHDVAPMAGGVADREQDGLARMLGFGQRLRPPRPPMHRVVLVLQQVGARLAPEPVLAVCPFGGVLLHLKVRAPTPNRPPHGGASSNKG